MVSGRFLGPYGSFLKSRFLVTGELCRVLAAFFRFLRATRAKMLLLRMQISAKNRKIAIFCGKCLIFSEKKSGIFPVCRRKMRFCVFAG